MQAPSLTLEGGRLRQSPQLTQGRNYEIVPEPVWRALYHWYGANLSLPRPVSTEICCCCGVEGAPSPSLPSQVFETTFMPAADCLHIPVELLQIVLYSVT